MTLSPPTVIVLDRDGVINRDSEEFIKTPEEWEALPGALEAIARLHRAGYVLAVATNQSGVGRGLLSVDTLWSIHRKMLTQILDAGGYIARIFFCLHAPEDGCDCRKPRPGLLYQVAEYFACGFDHMIMVGDSTRDIEAARAVGARTILVRTGKGRVAEATWNSGELPTVCEDLAAVADLLLGEQVVR